MIVRACSFGTAVRVTRLADVEVDQSFHVRTFHGAGKPGFRQPEIGGSKENSEIRAASVFISVAAYRISGEGELPFTACGGIIAIQFLVVNTIAIQLFCGI